MNEYNDLTTIEKNILDTVFENGKRRNDDQPDEYIEYTGALAYRHPIIMRSLIRLQEMGCLQVNGDLSDPDSITMNGKQYRIWQKIIGNY